MSEARNKLRKNILSWKRETFAKLKQETNKLGIEHRSNSPSNIPANSAMKAAHASRQGYINRITYKFPKHMVFVHKGVGRGVPIAKAGSAGINRKPKPWFNPVIEAEIGKLADTVAEDCADIAMEAIFIR